MVYTSSSLALAALEYFVRLDPEETVDDLVAVAADIPDSVKNTHVAVTDLPPNWRDYPAPPALADLGTRWAREQRAPVLAVPSAVIPQEPNYVLNPEQTAFGQIRIGRPQPFGFDPRMWRR